MKIATIDKSKLKKEMEKVNGRELDIINVEPVIEYYTREYTDGYTSNMDIMVDRIKVQALDIKTKMIITWYTDAEEFLKGRENK